MQKKITKIYRDNNKEKIKSDRDKFIANNKNLCPPSIWNVGPYEIVIGGNRRLVTFACLGALPKVWICKSL